jgi:hypothetical protein
VVVVVADSSMVVVVVVVSLVDGVSVGGVVDSGNVPSGLKT